MRIVGLTAAVVLLLIAVASMSLPVPSLAQLPLAAGLCQGAYVDYERAAEYAERDRLLNEALHESAPPLPPTAPLLPDTLRDWKTGAPVGPEDYNPGVDIQSVDLQLVRNGITISFLFAGRSAGFPYFAKMAIDQSSTTGEKSCLWCLALDFLSLRPAYAQGETNAFMGPGMRESVVLFVQIDGPGRASLQRVVGTTTRPLAGSVQVSDNRVVMTIPLTVAAELGVVRPGVRIVFGAVGPPPKSVYDRVPKQGAIQIGLPGRMSVDPAPMAKARFDLVAGGKDVLYYLDTNGDGLVDAIARDRNGDGRIDFLQSEGPVLLLGPGLQPIPFPEVEQNSVDNRKAFLALSSQFAYYTLVQDLNGDGDVADEGEFRSWLIRR